MKRLFRDFSRGAYSFIAISQPPEKPNTEPLTRKELWIGIGAIAIIIAIALYIALT